VNLLGGSHLRHKSQHRRNHGDDMEQPTHLSGFVQPYRVAKREVLRPKRPDAFVYRPENERRQLVDRTINLLWAAGRAFPQRAEPAVAVPTLPFQLRMKE
jgi:hypothetical protein